jgi:hypothetical protein
MKHYAKTIIAVVGAAATLVVAALGPDSEGAVNAVVAAVTAVLVYLVPNADA